MRTRLRPNSFVRVAADSTTVLTYAPLTNPAPLTVSISETEPSLESLEVVITNGSGQDVEVQSVSFTLTFGTGADSLTFTASGIEPSISDTVNWQVQNPVIGDGTVQYELIPATGSSVKFAAGASVVFELSSISANNVPGTSTVFVGEVLSTSEGNTSFDVTTFPYGFFFNSLTATVEQGSALVPVAQVGNGSTVTLIWNGSVIETKAYAVFYSTPTGGQQVAVPTIQGEWTSPPLADDTVFLVQVTTTTDQGAPLSATLSTAVSVSAPDISTRTVTATGAIVTKGAIHGVGIPPAGTVIMFAEDIRDPAKFDANGAGVAGTQYESWQVCNGKNGSPNLLNKFIAGAGDKYRVLSSGGQDAVTLVNGQMPQHSHGDWTGNTAPYLNYSGVYYNSQGTSAGIMYNNGVDDPNGNRPNLLTTKGLDDIQVSPHSHPIPSDGGDQAHENRPQFVALAYLMKMS